MERTRSKRLHAELRSKHEADLQRTIDRYVNRPKEKTFLSESEHGGTDRIVWRAARASDRSSSVVAHDALISRGHMNLESKVSQTRHQSNSRIERREGVVEAHATTKPLDSKHWRMRLTIAFARDCTSGWDGG